MSSDLSAPARAWFACICFWRVLLSGSFAGAVWRLARERESPAALPMPSSPVAASPSPDPSAGPDRALQVLALLQREGRLIDFLEQDVAAFSDADVGAAARVVHDGCRRALRDHAKLGPVRTEDEGARVTVESGFSPEEIKLTGNVRGAAPFTGTLRHRGWRVSELVLPTAVREHDASVLAPAEVEL